MEMNEKPAKKPKRANPCECTYMGCDRKFRYACRLKEHTDYVHKNIYHYRCDHVGENKIICGKTSETAHILKCHKKTHNLELKIPCACCTKLFFSPSQLQNHVDFVNGIFHNVCDYVDESGEKCGYKCEEGSALTSHKKTHDPELKIPCACCTRRFNSPGKLQSHMDYVAGIFHHICDHADKNGGKCEMTFEESGALARHKNMHIRDAQRDMAPIEDHHLLETRHTVQSWE